MKYKIVVITGPTASGKTETALELAQKIAPACIISVDSRQAYKNLPIITGQDIPVNCQIPVFMINTISLNQDISISSYTDQVFKIIKQESKTKNIILVGGSGLYLKAITSVIPTINIKPDAKLRATLNNKSVSDLQQMLKKKFPQKLASLNNSDINNPHRLIRAIEIAKSKPAKPWYSRLQSNCQFLFLGIKNSKALSQSAIKVRVLKRLKQGAVKEASQIIGTNKNILGLKELTDYINDKITKKELISLWTQSEYSYYKRQLTWFTRQPQIIWYDKNNKIKLIKKALSWLNKHQ